MATIDKLEYINNTRNLIKNALNTKFNSQIGDGDTFRSYAQKINDIYENWPKVSEENTNFTLNSTKEGKMKIELKGNTSQKTTIGVNLFTGKSSYSKTIWNVEFTISDSKVTINGQSNNSAQTNTLEKGFITPYQVEPSTVYTYKVFVLNGSFTGTRFAMNLRSGSTATSTSVQFNVGSSLELTSGTNSATFTSSSDSNYLTGLQFIFSADAKFTNLVLGIELVKGNTEPTTYEPYTNGASPNPDYPQDIHVVSGDNSIIVHGKNLLKYPYNETTKTTHEITFTDNGDGTIKISGTANANAYFNTYPNTTGKRIKLKAGTYTFSNDTLLPSGITITFSPRDSEGKVISGVNAVYLNNTTKEATRTINQDFEIFSNILVSNGTAITTPITIKQMIKVGSTASTFEAYKVASYPINLGDVELCKIETYQDYIYKSLGNWYKHGAVGKISSYNGETITTDYISSTGSLTTSATVYYGLTIPTDTQITDSILINQLEALKKAISYDEQTNISQENNDLPFILNVSALKKNSSN